MRKEVKRSLLLWPITASATISAALMLSFVAEVDSPATRLAKQAVSQATSVTPILLDEYLSEPVAELGVVETPVAERSEHGSRALKMPDRVADMFAPHRHIDGEIAEIGFDEQASISEILLGDLLSADHVAGEVILDDADIVARTLQSIPAKARVNELVPDPPAIEPDFVGPIFQDPAPIVFSTELPESTRILAKPDLRSPENNQQESMALEFQSREPTILNEPIELSKDDLASLQAPMITRKTQELAPEVQLDERNASGDVDRIEPSVVDHSLVGWPITKRLNAQLDHLASVESESIVVWTNEVQARLSELQSLPRIGDERAGILIDQLSSLADEGTNQANEISERELQVQWLRASYAISRRIAVWNPIWDISRTDESMEPGSETTTPAKIEQAIKAVRADLSETGDAEGWSRYLLLDEIQSSPQLEDRSILAQRVLSRLQWHGLDPVHREWLDRESIDQFASAIQPWVRNAVDYASLLNQIEMQEDETIDPIANEIAAAIQTLRFAESERAIRVANALDAHYRNANVRLAISQVMLQRILPTIAPKTMPVRTTMNGSKIRGISRIEADLRLALQPSPDRWNVSLQTHGKVRTNSTGFNGPVALRTAGNSSFVASTPIEISPRGLQVGGSAVSVQGQTRLQNIRSDYDGWPLVGPLVRGIAENRYKEMSTQSNRFANRKIKSQVSTEIRSQVDQRLDEATLQLSQALLGPLGKLQLDPKVMDMQTTDKRLLARYRLAGDWQLGANTPRPRAPRTSLMSLQVHQSAINNTLEQLVPQGKAILIRDLLKQGGEAFGQSDLNIPDDIPEDVSIQFSKTRPVSVEVEDGKVWLTMRIIRLKKGEKLNLTKFVVRAAYKPQIDGINATLVRDGHLRISGPGMSMRERLPVRAIFTKVLSPNHPIALTLPQLVEHPAAEGLIVSQLELRDGWIGLAISESDAPRVAMVEPKMDR